jgi:ARC6-like, IMS domain
MKAIAFLKLLKMLNQPHKMSSKRLKVIDHLFSGVLPRLVVICALISGCSAESQVPRNLAQVNPQGCPQRPPALPATKFTQKPSDEMRSGTLGAGDVIGWQLRGQQGQELDIATSPQLCIWVVSAQLQTLQTNRFPTTDSFIVQLQAQSSQASYRIGIKPPDYSAADQEIAAAISHQFTSREQAMGSEHNTRELSTAFTGKRLTTWQGMARDARDTNTAWYYKHEPEKILSITHNEDQAIAEVTYMELGASVRNGGYDSVNSFAKRFRVQYQMISKNGRWLISDVKVIEEVDLKLDPSEALPKTIAQQPSGNEASQGGNSSSESAQEGSLAQTPTGFPVGSSLRDVAQAYGAPSSRKTGYWPGTDAVIYEFEPKIITFGYIINPETQQIRQTEVSLSNTVDEQKMRKILDGMAGGDIGDVAFGQILRVHRGELSRYKFLLGNRFKGVSELSRSDSTHLYVGIWEADFHE